jgi:hypothetical protein
VTVTGDLVAAPRLDRTPAGTPVAIFTIASTPRTYDRGTGEWKDGETAFIRCTLWREAAQRWIMPRSSRHCYPRPDEVRAPEQLPCWRRADAATGLRTALMAVSKATGRVAGSLVWAAASAD